MAPGRMLGPLVLALTLGQACALAGPPAGAVRFSSLSGTSVDGYLFKPPGEGRHPALVFLHGCGGLVSGNGRIQSRETSWAGRLTGLGYVVFMVDSFSSRGIREMCSQAGFKQAVYLERPKDAYGALRYLQAQDFVRPDRIGVIGWSQGGGVLLYAIRAGSLGRPEDLPLGDFRAAVGFYPASCRETAHRVPWTTTVPLLVLVGERDVWTPAAPCKSLVDHAASGGAPVELRIYSGAYHDFDWPNLPVRTLPAYRTSAGVVPIIGMDPAAREDALTRVPEFLGRYLKD